jgi:hypothetical protein
MAVGWSFGVTIVFQVLYSIVAAFRPGAIDLVLAEGCQAAAYLLGLFVMLRVHAPDASIRDILGLRRTNLAFYPLAVLLGASLELPANALFSVILNKWPLKEQDPVEDLYRAAAAPRRAMIALAIVVAGPLLEEILFRGALFRLLRKTHPAELVILVTAALFTFAHVGWQSFLPIGFLALALSFLRSTSGSLVPTMLTHMTFNGISLALSLTSTPGAPEVATPLPFVAASAAAALLVLGGIHLAGARSATAAGARELDAR